MDVLKYIYIKIIPKRVDCLTETLDVLKSTGLFGIQIDPQTQAVLVDNVTALMSAGGAIVGAILGIYGRVKADKKVR